MNVCGKCRWYSNNETNGLIACKEKKKKSWMIWLWTRVPGILIGSGVTRRVFIWIGSVFSPQFPHENPESGDSYERNVNQRIPINRKLLFEAIQVEWNRVHCITTVTRRKLNEYKMPSFNYEKIIFEIGHFYTKNLLSMRLQIK